MSSINDRTKLFFKDDFDLIKDSKVLVVGIGGVGSFAAEALARTGVGSIYLTDFDTIDESNINRQIHATTKTVSLDKLTVMKDRINDINPNIVVKTIKEFDLAKTKDLINQVDYVIDAIDTITYKIELAKACLKNNVEFISCMGAANKLDPKALLVSRLDKTEYDPIARIMRYKMRKLGLSIKFPVIYSKEQPIKQEEVLNDEEIRKKSMPPASIIFVPATMGLIAANEAIKYIIKEK